MADTREHLVKSYDAELKRLRGMMLEMGGIGPIADTDYLSQEISIRGFWSFYHRIMDAQP